MLRLLDDFRQRNFRVKVVGPCLHRLMIDEMAGLDVFQRFKRQTAAFFLLINPGSQSLLDDPAARSFETHRQLVDFFGNQHLVSICDLLNEI